MAMMDGEVWIRNGSALFLGPGGSGKSHTLALFLKKDPLSKRESTPCMKTPIRAVAHCKVGVSNDQGNDCFIRITDDQYSDMLVVTAKGHLRESGSAAGNAAMTSKTSTLQQGITDIEIINSFERGADSEVKHSIPDLLHSPSVLDVDSHRILTQETVELDSGAIRGALRREFCTRMQAGSRSSDQLNSMRYCQLSSARPCLAS